MEPDSPPHVPAPFPYSWPAPGSYQPPAVQRTFALSSSSNLKRTRSPSPSDDDSGSEESDGQDLDQDDPYNLAPKRDEELRTPTPSSTELAETNIGMRMLLTMGWSAGKGLGKNLQGRVAPVDPSNNSGMMGLGKASLDSRMLDNTTLARKELESQKIAKETPDQRKARMERAAYKVAVEAEIASTLEKFRCDMCAKSYATVGQYDEHTNSYDHHHRARAVALKNAAREKSNASGDSERRREKERKREAKELARVMGAVGVAPPVVSTAVPSAKPVEAKEEKKSGGGWAKFGAFGPAKTSTSTPTLPPSAKPSGTGGSRAGKWSRV